MHNQILRHHAWLKGPDRYSRNQLQARGHCTVSAADEPITPAGTDRPDHARPRRLDPLSHRGPARGPCHNRMPYRAAPSYPTVCSGLVDIVSAIRSVIAPAQRGHQIHNGQQQENCAEYAYPALPTGKHQCPLPSPHQPVQPPEYPGLPPRTSEAPPSPRCTHPQILTPSQAT